MPFLGPRTAHRAGARTAPTGHAVNERAARGPNRAAPVTPEWIAPRKTTWPAGDDKPNADAASYGENIPYVTYFETSVQGLSRGAPVQLFGVQVGTVSDVKLVLDPDTRRMVARVAFDLQPERVLGKDEAGPGDLPARVRQAFAGTGLRVVLESSSFLTGAKDLSIIYAPAERMQNQPKEGDAIVLPSQGGGMDSLTASLSDVAAKIDKIPFERIGQNANAALETVQHLAEQMDTNLTPTLAQLPSIAEQLSEAARKANGALGPQGYGQNSEFQRGVERLMDHLTDTARSVRVLADYLDRHPEAFIRGRAAQTGVR